MHPFILTQDTGICVRVSSRFPLGLCAFILFAIWAISAARCAQAQVNSGQLERPAGTRGPTASTVDHKATDSKPPGR